MRPSTLLQFGLLALVTACDVTVDAPLECDGCEDRWRPPGFPNLSTNPALRGKHVRLEVQAGHIFAADFTSDRMAYWIIDPLTGIIENETIVVNPNAHLRRGSVVVRAIGAAGIYVTTPNQTDKPSYPVSFVGHVQDDGVFSYLEPHHFDELRVLDPAPMVATHDAMLTGAEQLLDTFEADLEDHRARVTTTTFEAVLAAEEHLAVGAQLLTDSPDVHGASTAAMAPWAADLFDLQYAIDANAQADAAIAQGNSLTLESQVPDGAAIQAHVEACVDAIALADDIDAVVTQLFPQSVAQDTYDYDGRRGGAPGPITDPVWQRDVDALEAYLDGIKDLGAAYEHCVNQAVGGEPTVVYDDILPDPYEAIGAQAESEAYAAEADALGLYEALRATYADEIAQPEAAYDPAVWGAAEAHAMTVLEGLVGTDLLADPPVATPSPGPTPVASAAKGGSSQNACDNPTPVFQINIGGLGLAIGTPFDDRIRGADAAGFEVLVGGKGDDCINGLDGHELIFGNAGDDELHGGDGHEIVFGNAGEDTIFAGDGEDYGITIPTVPPTTITLDVGSLVFGGPDDDDISGADPSYDPADDTFFGFTDVLFGDGITGTRDDDIVNGGAGIDFLFAQDGTDIVVNKRPGRIRYSLPATSNLPAVTADVEFGSFHFGGQGVDRLDGCDAIDLMFGNDGDDTMLGDGGFDLMFGGEGDDPLIDGQDGVDLVFGGAGEDTVRGGAGIDLVMGNDARDEVFGDAGPFDLIFGNADNDRVNRGGRLRPRLRRPGARPRQRRRRLRHPVRRRRGRHRARRRRPGPRVRQRRSRPHGGWGEPRPDVRRPRDRPHARQRRPRHPVRQRRRGLARRRGGHRPHLGERWHRRHLRR